MQYRESLELNAARKAAYGEARNGGIDAVDTLLRSPLIDAGVKLSIMRALNAAFAHGVDQGIGFAQGEDALKVYSLIGKHEAEKFPMAASSPSQEEVDMVLEKIPSKRKLSVVFDLPLGITGESK